MQTEIKTLDLGSVNCYLINTERGFILIDTGGCTFNNFDLPGIRSKLDAELASAGCKPGNLQLVIITHSDADHVGNGAYIQKKYQTKIAIHTLDAEQVENPDMGKYLRSVKFNSVFLTIMVKLLTLFMQLGLMKKFPPLETFTPDLLVEEGLSLAPYGWDAKILHLPGHSKGSIGILTAANDLICGDIFNNFKKPLIAMNAVDFKVLYASVDRIKTLNINKVYPGHGKPFLMSELSKGEK